MKTQILNEGESALALKEFFEQEEVNPYDYILIREVTDDIDFQNELLKCLKAVRDFVNNKGFQDISDLFLFKFVKGDWFAISFEENKYIWNCKFHIDNTFNDKKFLENKEILEMYIGTSLFGNEF